MIEEWAPGCHYHAGVQRLHNGAVYECTEPHGETSPDRPPDANPSHWVKVMAPEPGPPGPPGTGFSATYVTSADVANSLIASADVAPASGPALRHSMAAGTRYFFRALVRYTSAAAATGLGLGVNGPVGSVVSAAVRIAETATTGRNGVVSALDGNVQGLASAGATEMFGTVEGTILCGATAGALAIRFRSEVAGSAVTAKAGSLLTVWT